MEEQLRQAENRVVGTKQVLRAIRNGNAARVFLCKDADDFLYRQVEAACEEQRVPITVMDSMVEISSIRRPHSVNHPPRNVIGSRVRIPVFPSQHSTGC